MSDPVALLILAVAAAALYGLVWLCTAVRAFDRARDLRETVDDAVDLRRVTHVVQPHREVHGVRRLLERPFGDPLLEPLPELEIHVVGVNPDGPRGSTRPIRA